MTEGLTRLIARNRLHGLALAVLVLLALPLGVKAVTSISGSYSADSKLALGSIVSLAPNTTDHVVAAQSNNVDNLLGVVISNESSLLSVNSGKDNQVQIATNGTQGVLVSDINGPITQGDHITASPIAGVGMKATGNVRIIGVAQSELGNNTIKQKYKDDNNTEREVTLGQVPVLVNVAYYFKEPDKTLIPQAIQNLANSLAGRNVPAIPILVSAGIFVIMMVAVASITYSMIRSSLISVGRNPMSQSAVYRNLVQMSAIVILILGAGFAAIYLVLTRIG